MKPNLPAPFLNIHVVVGMLRITYSVHLHKDRAVGCRVCDGILSSRGSGVTGNGNSWVHEQLPTTIGYQQSNFG